MIKIVKGNQTMIVAKRTYETIFAPAGWAIEENGVGVTAPPTNPTDEDESLNLDPPAGEDDDESDDSDELDPDTDLTGSEDDEDSDEEFEELSDEDLQETPLGELNFGELKRLALLKGLDIKGMKSKKEVKALIKANL